METLRGKNVIKSELQLDTLDGWKTVGYTRSLFPFIGKKTVRHIHNHGTNQNG